MLREAWTEALTDGAFSGCWRFEERGETEQRAGRRSPELGPMPGLSFRKTERIENKEQLRPSAWFKFHTLINVCTERRKYLTANDKLSRFKPLWDHIIIELILIKTFKEISN